MTSDTARCLSVIDEHVYEPQAEHRLVQRVPFNLIHSLDLYEQHDVFEYEHVNALAVAFNLRTVYNSPTLSVEKVHGNFLRQVKVELALHAF